MRDYIVLLDKIVDADSKLMFQISIAPATPQDSPMAATYYANWDAFVIVLRIALTFDEPAVARLAEIQEENWQQRFVIPLSDDSARSLGCTI